MKRLLLILLCVPLMFSCADENENVNELEEEIEGLNDRIDELDKKDDKQNINESGELKLEDLEETKKEDVNEETKKESSVSLIDNRAEITILGNETINFGEIIEGEKVDLEFRIKNTGTGDLIITNAKASCGCTKLEYPKEIIKPGNEDNISVTFDSTRKPGKQKKQITLTTNSTPSIKILSIEGNVLPSEN